MLRASILTLAVRICAVLLWLGFNIAVARLVDIDTFGTVFFIITFAQFGSQTLLLGYNVVLLNRISVLWDRRQTPEIAALTNEARWTVLVSSAFLFAGLSVLSVLGVASPVTHSFTLMLAAVLLSVLVGFMSLHMEVLRSTGQLLKALIGTSFMRPFGSLLLLLPLIGFGLLSAEAVLLAHAMALVAAIVLELYWLKNLISGSTLSRPHFPNLRAALEIWPGEVSLVILARAPVLVLGFGSDAVGLALLVAADRIGMMGQFLLDAIRLAIGPSLVVAHKNGIDDLKSSLERASILMFCGGLVGALGLAGLGWAILWAFGEQYIAAYPFALALLAAQTTETVFGPTHSLATISGLAAFRSKLMAATTVVMVTLQLFVLPIAGVWGVVTVFVLAMWVMNTTLWLAVWKRTGLRSGILGVTPSRFLQVLGEEWACCGTV